MSHIEFYRECSKTSDNWVLETCIPLIGCLVVITFQFAPQQNKTTDTKLKGWYYAPPRFNSNCCDNEETQTTWWFNDDSVYDSGSMISIVFCWFVKNNVVQLSVNRKREREKEKNILPIQKVGWLGTITYR